MLDNALRETIGRFQCKDLVSSCALLGETTGGLGSALGDQTNANLVEVQQAIAKALN